MQTTIWPDVVVPVILVLLWIALSPLPSYLISWWNSKSKRRGVITFPISTKQDSKNYSGYIIPVLIHHARILPRESQHSFRYPSIFLALNLEHLEVGRVEENLSKSYKGLARRIFSWKPRCNGRWSLTKLDPEGFGRRVFTGMNSEMQGKLKDSMLLKLMYELRLRGYIRKGPQDVKAHSEYPDEGSDRPLPWSDQIGQVWAVAMPSLLGMGGFNPLTIYYVYRPSSVKEEVGKSRKLWLVILEVHNTFNERHVYICEVGKNEDEDVEATRRRRYQHSWSFPRAFHVSPFNDRSGYYQLLMNDLWRSSIDDKDNKDIKKSPTLDIRLLLMTEVGEEDVENDSDDTEIDKVAPTLQKKLLATLCSRDAPSASLKSHRDVQVLTAFNLVRSLLAQPLDLMLPVSRIMWEAARLHWKRRLPVFIRPEQSGQELTEGKESSDNDKSKRGLYDGIGWPIDLNPIQPEQNMSSSSGAIYWNQDGLIEKACQRQFDDYLVRQTRKKQDILVYIVSRNAEVSAICYYNGNKTTEIINDVKEKLIIYTLSSSLFVDFALYTPAQARLFGSIIDRNWGVNSIELYESIFDTSTSIYPQGSKRWKGKLLTWIQQNHLRWACKVGYIDGGDKDKNTERRLIAQNLLHDLTTRHPYSKIEPSISFVLALLLQMLLIKMTALFSNLLHICYVRAPWSSVGEGIEYLQKQPKKIPYS